MKPNEALKILIRASALAVISATDKEAEEITAATVVLEAAGEPVWGESKLAQLVRDYQRACECSVPGDTRSREDCEREPYRAMMLHVSANYPLVACEAVNSRSRQKRIAAMKGEEPPTFSDPANPLQADKEASDGNAA